MNVGHFFFAAMVSWIKDYARVELRNGKLNLAKPALLLGNGLYIMCG